MKGLNLTLKEKDGKIIEKTKITVGGCTFGEDFVMIGGPCSVESEKQVMLAAKAVKEAGGHILRGGAYKPRTSPYSFQGLGRVGLEYLQKAGKAYDLPIVTEVVDTRDVYFVAEKSDIIQIGTRNMQNFSLLHEVGLIDKPVILKRGMNSTLEEWLNAAEYILSAGNKKVILCERGIRTVETYTRNTLDLSIVSAIKKISNLPIIVDPSHGTGRVDLIEPMTLSSIMAGADGFLIEVHPEPSKALSDKEQQLNPQQFKDLVKKVNKTVKFYKENI